MTLLVCDRYSRAYDGGTLFYFNQMVCFKCGNCVKFLFEDGRETVFEVNPADGLGALSMHPTRDVLAYSDRKLKPNIHIKLYPNLGSVAVLQGTPSKAEIQRITIISKIIQIIFVVMFALPFSL